ncbi:2-C-methyl-D-erythritol 2,4-cyclodiphosphate synthase [Fodinibius salsisoli]|uniref:2-C-methyl-D-erythritol 2,4-cyclodiphosphate synthase n=1 Tax=Fodinibius salsisoli TaxID=2820877 RepID=A0ABT3PNI9_9BACT|nr:2-C-methyl-D-erythritol 2,4-cyclodiphosphate synthase [Fodinibius salsisoli]MCW9707431.1 2-C-methyl-D-erythritol 2,4-cyclodiphosphate synthase [Fodinibius salsisoli]
MRIGYGYDVHGLEKGHSLILGGVAIPHTKGLVGHSDADVLLHAITDALLGACALGDIGQHFPDTDNAFAGADSRVLLREVVDLIRQKGFMVANVDATIVAERPRLASYIDDMRKNIADDLSVDVDQVSVKATTSEGMGFEGNEKGISARAVSLLTEQSNG